MLEIGLVLERTFYFHDLLLHTIVTIRRDSTASAGLVLNLNFPAIIAAKVKNLSFCLLISLVYQFLLDVN
ncbi:MAG: hypothetical protein A2V67_01840 [Deltaproteobacteria bacterium RBG_13_61_14]|nr:MAG: hypothetical protein A2V67_01840 [Deltaproteobacteria bacterium RBG_13_61_14]